MPWTKAHHLRHMWGILKIPGRGSCGMDDFSAKFVFNMREDVHIPKGKETIKQVGNNKNKCKSNISQKLKGIRIYMYMHKKTKRMSLMS